MTVEELLRTIQQYDSDTFFAKGLDLTEQESLYLAAGCIHWFLDNRLDGVILDQMLAELREEE